MPLVLAIPFAFLIVVATTILSQALQAPALSVAVLIAGGVWVYFDAKKLDLERYRTALRYPELACFGTILLWIFVFPWYLSVRHRIVHGQMPLRDPPPE
jgi:hypothetical protein